MRVLLDTNILIHREAPTVVHPQIGQLFRWLDRLHHEKCVHRVSTEEIDQHGDERVRESFRAKLASYQVLSTTAPMAPEVRAVGDQLDTTDNDRRDTVLLNELVAGRVDMLITEDRGLARKARLLGIADQVVTIDEFLERTNAENPGLVDYRSLSVRKLHCGELAVADPFFDSLRAEYDGFDRWFARKSEEPAYVCTQYGALVAFLYLKIEDTREPYPDIEPRFPPARRLKIGTFKVVLLGCKLGERLLKIVFDNAIRQRVDQVYVTLFPTSVERQWLVTLLEAFGFARHGTKSNPYGVEDVYVRDMTPGFDADNPAGTFPYLSRTARALIVPIYREYHTSLLPDSILRTETPDAFIEQEPHRNAIRKVYVSRSLYRDVRTGDQIVFYRTGGKYRGVATTIGIVDQVYHDIASDRQFVRLCRGRSVFSDDQLLELWNYRPRSRPFVVGFLYAYALPKRPNLDELVRGGVVRDIMSVPRGFEPLTQEQFSTILSLANADPRIVVD